MKNKKHTCLKLQNLDTMLVGMLNTMLFLSLNPKKSVCIGRRLLNFAYNVLHGPVSGSRLVMDQMVYD
jgi:hypothetical protein